MQVTTYSGVIGRRGMAAVKIGGYSFFRLNIALLLLLVLLMTAYIFLANLRVAWEYSLNSRKNQLNALNARPLSQNINSANPDLETLLLFARKSGMIEAKDANSILQDRNFALTPQ